VRTFVIVLLGVLVLVAGVLVPTMWFDLRELRDAEAAGVAALGAAKRMTPGLLSYDYRTVEEDLARAGAHTTGELTGHYKKLRASLVAGVKAQKSVRTAGVVAGSVVSAEPDRVAVLLFVNTDTVKEIPGQDVPERLREKNRIRLVMVRRDTGWMAAEMSTLLGTA
jgi:Mce-associated membrane protein